MPPNRLASEKNPYLLQHALNPVDWYPWGEDAFQKARQQDKPVFLSIGYSTCHWCHVMAHESFEDPQVAALMNDVFVCIKVDREERPDIDRLYMAIGQMMTGSGGWPLTMIMTPDKRPLYAATYIPRESRYGQIGMMEIIPFFGQLWEEKRHELVAAGDQALADFQGISVHTAGHEPTEQHLHQAFQELSARYDAEHGGFRPAPKFPAPHTLMFLLRYWNRTGDKNALQMVCHTLRAMRQGGIYDHVGFGFHRYSTDERWLVPHFEKMLYDQALLAMVYVEGYQACGQDLFRQTAEEVVTYMLRDLAAPQGGFYSAEDADSRGVEGAFYLWREEEIRDILPPSEADLVLLVSGIKAESNFPCSDGAAREAAGIIHGHLSMAEAATSLGMSEGEVGRRWESARARLFLVRNSRPRPFCDEKILADWNGLAIAALAKAGRVCGRADYVEAAEKAAHFVLETMSDGQGHISHCWCDGRVSVPGLADDYAFLAWGLLELYEATFRTMHLEQALELTEDMLRRFWDEEHGGLFLSGDETGSLCVRQKEIYDGAVPSANSVAAINLIRLGRLLGRPDLEDKAVQIGRTFAGDITSRASAYTHFLSSMEWVLGCNAEVVIAGDIQSPEGRNICQALSRRFHPNVAMLHRPAGALPPETERLLAHIAPMTAVRGSITMYVCRNQHCAQPTSDLSQVLAMLEQAGPGGRQCHHVDTT